MVLRDRLAEAPGLPRQAQQLEVERKVDLLAGLTVVAQELVDGQVDLADQHPLVVLVEHSPHAGE